VELLLERSLVSGSTSLARLSEMVMVELELTVAWVPRNLIQPPRETPMEKLSSSTNRSLVLLSSTPNPSSDLTLSSVGLKKVKPFQSSSMSESIAMGKKQLEICKEVSSELGLVLP